MCKYHKCITASADATSNLRVFLYRYRHKRVKKSAKKRITKTKIPPKKRMLLMRSPIYGYRRLSRKRNYNPKSLDPGIIRSSNVPKTNQPKVVGYKKSRPKRTAKELIWQTQPKLHRTTSNTALNAANPPEWLSTVLPRPLSFKSPPVGITVDPLLGFK